MLSVWLDAQLEQRLSALAEKTNRSKSDIAKEALIRYIEAEEAKDYEKRQALAPWGTYQEPEQP